MNPDDIVTQIGLIFSQMRYIRINVEQIERNVSRYTGLSLEAFAPGTKFGAPPMIDGALAVHLVNIGDLVAEDNSFGGFFSGIFRGISSLFAGAITGVIGGVLAPVNLAIVGKITGDVLQIVKLLGFSGQKSDKKGEESSGNTLDTLREITNALTLAREVLLGATREPAPGEQTKPIGNFLGQLADILGTVGRIVDGIVLAIPLAIGALASLLLKLEQLRLILGNLLEFAIRNLLLVRGFAVVVIFDTLAVVARLVSEMLRILGTSVSSILDSIFRMIETAMDAAFTAFEAMAKALKAVVDAVLPWVVNTLLQILTAIGNTSAFQRLDSIIYNLAIAASVLPGSSSAVPSAPPGGSLAPPSLSASLLKMPDFTAAPGVTSAIASAVTTIDGAASVMSAETKKIFGSASAAAADLAAASKDALTSATTGFNSTLDRNLGEVQKRATEFSSALGIARTAMEQDKDTGLEKIAAAYEGWLSGGGLDQIMQRITDRFSRAESGGDSTARQLLDRILGQAAAEPPRPTVEIPEMTIEFVPPTAGGAKAGAGGKPGAVKKVALEIDPEPDDAEVFARGGLVAAWG
ncbi:MAG: hypothetical protein U0Q18_27660 [Bryobacteraceae bacterium]